MSDMEKEQGVRALALAKKMGRREESPRVEQQEEGVAWALIAAAIRRGDEAGVNRWLDEFGYVPWVNGCKDLLAMSAMSEGSVGFMRMLEMRWDEWTVGLADSDTEKDGSKFLRRGLVNSPDDISRFRNFNSGGVWEGGAVAAVLSVDNPQALAWMLADPMWRAALEKGEPRPVADRDALSEKQRMGEAYGGSFKQKSLLWHAVAMQAPRCARVLMEFPQFCQSLLADEVCSAQEDNVRMGSDASADLIKAINESMGRKSGKGPDPELAFKEAGDSFFEMLAMLAVRGARGEKYSGEDAMWMDAALAAMERVDQSALRPQKESGRGWAEIAAWWGAKGGGEAQRAYRARTLIEAMDAKGFKVDWERVAAIFGRGSSEQAAAMGVWAALHGPDAGKPASAAGVRKSL